MQGDRLCKQAVEGPWEETFHSWFGRLSYSTWRFGGIIFSEKGLSFLPTINPLNTYFFKEIWTSSSKNGWRLRHRMTSKFSISTKRNVVGDALSRRYATLNTIYEWRRLECLSNFNFQPPSEFTTGYLAAMEVRPALMNRVGQEHKRMQV